jgi:predicted NUDIX family phosphoesterase
MEKRQKRRHLSSFRYFQLLRPPWQCTHGGDGVSLPPESRYHPFVARLPLPGLGKEHVLAAVPNEHVLVVPTELFHRLGYFQGFSGEVARYLPGLLNGGHVAYRLRVEVEEDPRWKQLIPYVIFRHRNSDGRTWLFQYTRGGGMGEGRLHRKRSVGIGGHISVDDAKSPLGANPYEEGLRRELAEEVEIATTATIRCVGLINDDETPVGRVHLGVVHLCDVPQPAVRPREPEIIASGFCEVAELLANLESFESWSQICLRAIFGAEKSRE